MSGGQIDCWPPAGGAQVHFSPKFQSHLAEIKLQQFTMQFRKLILSQAVFKKTEKENAYVMDAHLSKIPQKCPPRFGVGVLLCENCSGEHPQFKGEP